MSPMVTGEKVWKMLQSYKKNQYILRTGVKKIATKAIIHRKIELLEGSGVCGKSRKKEPKVRQGFVHAQRMYPKW